MVIFKYVYSKLKNNHSRILNPAEYFPEEELHSLRQIFYLIMMGFFFVIILYTLIFINEDLYIVGMQIATMKWAIYSVNIYDTNEHWLVKKDDNE